MTAPATSPRSGTTSPRVATTSACAPAPGSSAPSSASSRRGWAGARPTGTAPTSRHRRARRGCSSRPCSSWSAGWPRDGADGAPISAWSSSLRSDASPESSRCRDSPSSRSPTPSTGAACSPRSPSPRAAGRSRTRSRAPGHRGRGGSGIAVALVAVVWGFGAQTVDVLEHTDHLSDTEAAAEDVYAQVRAQGLPTRPVLVRALGVTYGGLDQGLIDALDHDGAPVRVDRQYGYHFGDQRTADPSDVAEVWYVGEEGRYKTLLPELPGARVVATTTPLSRADERELRTLQREAIDALRAAGRGDLVDTVDNRLFELLMAEQFPNGVPGLSRAKVDRIAELNRRSARADRAGAWSWRSPPTRIRSCRTPSGDARDDASYSAAHGRRRERRPADRGARRGAPAHAEPARRVQRDQRGAARRARRGVAASRGRLRDAARW